MTPEEISVGLKAKYPQYKDMPDEVLLPKLFEKHPVYQKLLTTPSNAQETPQVPEDDFLRRQIPAKLAQSTNLPAQAIGKILSNLPYQDFSKPTTPEETTDLVMNLSPMGMAGSVGKAARSGLETHLLGILKQNLPGKNQALIALAEKNPVQALKSGLNVKDWPKIDKWINEFKNLGHEGPELEALVNSKAKELIDEVNGVGLEAPKVPFTTSNAAQSERKLTGSPKRNKMVDEDMAQVSVKTQGQPPVSMEGWQVLGKGEGITSYASPEGVRVDIPDGVEPGQFLNNIREAESLRGGTSPIPKAPEPIVQPSNALEVPKEQTKVAFNKEMGKTPNADPFYSKLQRVLDEPKIPENMPSQGLINTLLKQQVKPDEIKWSGLDKFLEGKERVTKAEVQQYLKENDFHVNEIDLKGAEYSKTKEEFRLADRYGDPLDTFGVFGRRQDAENIRLAQRRPQDFQVYSSPLENREIANPVHYGPETHPDLQIPGAIRHEETLYQLPSTQKGIEYKDMPKPLKRLVDTWNKNEGMYPQEQLDTLAKQHGYTLQQDTPEGNLVAYKLGEVPNTFQGGHYDEPNVLAHVLRDEIKIGKDKVSLLNEKQSDWHQQGGQEGYKTGIKEKDTPQMVPDGPFKKNWNLLIDKREIRRAAERKQDGLAWPAGEVIADRYSLRKHLDELHYRKNPNGTYELMYTKKGGLEAQPFHQDLTKEGLVDTVGKGIAERIIKGEGEPNTLASMGGNHTTLKGEGLEIGGTWHKKMYDQKFVDDLNTFVKPFGAKMEKVQYKTPNAKPVTSIQKQDLNEYLEGALKGRGGDFEDVALELKEQYNFIVEKPQFDTWIDMVQIKNPRASSVAIKIISTEIIEANIHKKPIPMWYLKFTPALKRAALKEGFPLFTGLGALGLVGKEVSSKEKK